MLDERTCAGRVRGIIPVNIRLDLLGKGVSHNLNL